MRLTVIEVRRGRWWTNGFASVLVVRFYVQFQSLGSGLITIFLAWVGLRRVGKADAFVAGAIGS